MKRKGIALVTTIMVLVVLTLLAAGMMFTIKNETAISIHQAHNVKVVQVAEAGLDEITYRLKLDRSDADFIGDTLVPLDPDWTTYIVFGAPPADTGSVFFRQSLQNNLTGFSSSSPDLDYTTVNADYNLSLKISHKTNSAGTEIYFFDSHSQRQFLGPPSMVNQFSPVEVVEITARSGTAVKKIIAEVAKQELQIMAQSALTTTSLAWEGVGANSTKLCGHNHLISTPWRTYPSTSTALTSSCWYEIGGIPQYHVTARYDTTEHPTYNHFLYNPATGSFSYQHIEFDDFCSEVACVAGAATKGSASQIHGAATGRVFGNPDIIVRSEITVPDLWDMLGYNSKTEMLNDPSMNWQGDITNFSGSGEFHNYHLTNASGTVLLPKNSHTITYTHGIVYVDDSLEILSGGGPFTCGFLHKGLVYVEKDCIEGGAGGAYDFWLLGAMMVKGQMLGKKAGITKFTWLYCSEALKQSVSETKSFYRILGWKEVD